MTKEIEEKIEEINPSVSCPFDISVQKLSDIIKFDLSKEERNNLKRDYVNYFKITNHRELDEFTVYVALPRLLLQHCDFCNINEFPAIKTYVNTIEWF